MKDQFGSTRTVVTGFNSRDCYIIGDLQLTGAVLAL